MQLNQRQRQPWAAHEECIGHLHCPQRNMSGVRGVRGQYSLGGMLVQDSGTGTAASEPDAAGGEQAAKAL